MIVEPPKKIKFEGEFIICNLALPIAYYFAKIALRENTLVGKIEQFGSYSNYNNNWGVLTLNKPFVNSGKAGNLLSQMVDAITDKKKNRTDSLITVKSALSFTRSSRKLTPTLEINLLNVEILDTRVGQGYLLVPYSEVNVVQDFFGFKKSEYRIITDFQYTGNFSFEQLNIHTWDYNLYQLQNLSLVYFEGEYFTYQSWAKKKEYLKLLKKFIEVTEQEYLNDVIDEKQYEESLTSFDKLEKIASRMVSTNFEGEKKVCETKFIQLSQHFAEKLKVKY